MFTPSSFDLWIFELLENIGFTFSLVDGRRLEPQKCVFFLGLNPEKLSMLYV